MRWTILAWMVLLLPLSRGIPAELEDFQEYIAAQIDLADRQLAEKLRSLNSMYIGSISNLVDQARASGNLARVLQLREVVQTFAREGPSVQGPPLSEDPEFVRLQDSWSRLRSDIQRQHAARMLGVLRTFDASLEQLQIRLTRDGEIEKAKAVQDERRKWSDDPRVKEWREKTAAASEPAPPQESAQGPELPVLAAYQSSLVLYFPFDRDDRSRVIDRSRARNHGNAEKLQWESTGGPRGGFVTFDGKESGIVVPNHKSLQITGDLTIAFWLRPRVLDGRRNPLNKAYGGEYTLTLEPRGVINFYYGTAGRDGEPYTGFSMERPIGAGEWSHVAVVRDMAAKTVTWYVNGKPAGQTATKYPEAAASTAPVRVGRGYVHPFEGSLDEIMIFAQALGPSDIQRIFRTTGGR